ncbi:translation initiation factor IF-2-like [Trachypithecus francoisi]|uniref:translation initiation factor IF-2-like n=1 Tax=Trachypithecus francoisi TaxID=54180 RepID=UPI00141ADA05|nr:translation initiation factor IF-2-like [Trachypithecus francoisi]
MQSPRSPGAPRRLLLRTGGYICRARPPPPGPRLPGARPGRRRRPPLRQRGWRWGPRVRARTHRRERAQRRCRRRPPAHWAGEKRGAERVAGRGALRRPPSRTCPTWKTQIPVSNTWETFSPAAQRACASAPSPGDGPAPRRIHAPHSPGPGGCGPEAGPPGGVALPVTFARGEGRGRDSVRAAGAGTAGEAQTLLGVFGTWRQSPLGGAARPPGNAGERPASLKTRPGPNGPRDSSLRDHGTQRLPEPAPQPLTVFVPAPTARYKYGPKQNWQPQ